MPTGSVRYLYNILDKGAIAIVKATTIPNVAGTPVETKLNFLAG
jgi:hypothetical protein